MVYALHLGPAEALHKDIKATFARAPAARDAYVSTEVRWSELEKLFKNPSVTWPDLTFNFLFPWGGLCCLCFRVQFVWFSWVAKRGPGGCHLWK